MAATPGQLARCGMVRTRRRLLTVPFRLATPFTNSWQRPLLQPEVTRAARVWPVGRTGGIRCGKVGPGARVGVCSGLQRRAGAAQPGDRDGTAGGRAGHQFAEYWFDQDRKEVGAEFSRWQSIGWTVVADVHDVI